MWGGIHLHWDISSENKGNPQDTQRGPNFQSGVGIITHLPQESGNTESQHLLHKNQGKRRFQAQGVARALLGWIDR